MYRTPLTTQPKKAKVARGAKTTACTKVTEPAEETAPALTTPNPAELRSAADEARRGELAGDMTTSTPLMQQDTDLHSKTYTRSESALLRIKTTIRAATAAGNSEGVKAMSEPIDAERDGDELGGSFSDRSRCSVGTEGGGLLSDLPQRANLALQSAKTALESSGNLRRDIKESLVGSLHTLYEMVLRLADSRSRHMLERQREMVAYEKRLAKLESNNAKHLRAVQDRAQREVSEHRGLLESIARDMTAQRSLVVADLRECLEKMKDDSETTRVAPAKPRERTSNLGEELEPIRKTLKAVQTAVSAGPRAGDALEREELLTEIRKLRSDLKSTTTGTRELRTHLTEFSAVRDHIMGLEEGRLGEIKTINGRLGTIDAELRNLSAGVDISPIVTKINRTEEALRNDNDVLRRTTAEGLEQIRDEITVASALRPAGPSIHEELTRGAHTGVTRHTDDQTGEWTLVGRGRGRRGRVRESIALPGLDIEEASTRREDTAEVTPSHAVVIESVDPRHTSDDVSKKIRAELDVVKLGIGVNSLRKVRGQKVLVGCDSVSDQKKLQESLMELGIGLTAETRPLKNPLLRMIGVTNDLTNERIVEAIHAQNKGLLGDLATEHQEIRVVRRVRGRIREVSNIIIQVGPKLWTRLRDRKIRVGFQAIPVYDQTPVIQCYRCLEFGHVARHCKGQVACGHCAEAHETRSCMKRESDPLCKNCTSKHRPSGHPAYSSQCPEWQKWDKLTRRSTDYGQC